MRRWSVATAAATVCGLGFVPKMPGTVGSSAALLLYLWLPLQMSAQAWILAAVCLAGLWASGAEARRTGSKDPSHVVIDEVAGMLIACFMLPKSWPLLAAAFMLFRVLDIAKWPPMRQLERLPGGWGIMLDDVAAGLIVRLALLPWAPLA